MKELNTYREGMDDNDFPKSLLNNPFEVPQDYFQKSEADLLALIKLENLKEMNAFQLPEADYFNQLSDNIMAKVAEEQLKTKVSRDGFQVPQGYFSQLEYHIISTLQFENKQLSSKNGGFVIPEYYFPKLTARLEQQIAADQASSETKVITLPNRKGSANWLKYGIAASIISVLSIGGYAYMNTESDDYSNGRTETEAHLAQIPDQDIINYLAASSDGDDIVYLTKYMNEELSETSGSSGDISKKEIEDYLNYSF